MQTFKNIDEDIFFIIYLLREQFRHISATEIVCVVMWSALQNISNVLSFYRYAFAYNSPMCVTHYW